MNTYMESIKKDLDIIEHVYCKGNDYKKAKKQWKETGELPEGIHKYDNIDNTFFRVVDHSDEVDDFDRYVQLRMLKAQEETAQNTRYILFIVLIGFIINIVGGLMFMT